MQKKHTPPNPFWQPLKHSLKYIRQVFKRALPLTTTEKSAEAGVVQKEQRAPKKTPQPGSDIVDTKLMTWITSCRQRALGLGAKAFCSSWSIPRRLRIWLIISGIAMVLGLIAWRLLVPAGGHNLEGLGSEHIDPRPTVESDIVTSQSITQRVKSVGTLKATDSAIMKSEVAGVVAQIFFKDGSDVKKGDLLVQIDDAVQSSIYQSKVSEYRAKKAQYDRFKELFKLHITPEQKLDEAQMDMEVAHAGMLVEKVKLAQFQIKAPFDGIIGLRDISTGTYVQPAQEIINVINLHPIKVDFKVPEGYLKSLEKGQKAIVKVDGFEGVDFIASIDAIDPKIDPEGHSILIRASIENLDAQLRPGMFANVELTLGEQVDALMVPESAVDRSGADEFVFVLRDIRGEKIAIRTVVSTGLREGGKVQILEGLTAGAEIVTAGHIKIRDGFQVRVTNKAPSPGKMMRPSQMMGPGQQRGQQLVGAKLHNHQLKN